MDGPLKIRSAEQKTPSEIDEISIERMAQRPSRRSQITPAGIKAFSKLKNEKPQAVDGDIPILGEMNRLSATLSEQNEQSE